MTGSATAGGTFAALPPTAFGAWLAGRPAGCNSSRRLRMAGPYSALTWDATRAARATRPIATRRISAVMAAAEGKRFEVSALSARAATSASAAAHGASGGTVARATRSPSK
jgi:hypothetical protein